MFMIIFFREILISRRNKLKAYELLLMVKPNIDGEEVQVVANKITETVESLGGKVTDTDLMGRKKLAYDINNFRDAFMVVLKLELPKDKVAELNRVLRLNENVLRTMFMELSKVKA